MISVLTLTRRRSRTGAKKSKSSSSTDSNPLLTLQWKNGNLTIIDQRLLPARARYRRLSSLAAVADAIRTLAVRGAPAIGIAAAYGVLVALKPALRKAHSAADLAPAFEHAVKTLNGTRPTAVNLFWALDRMRRAFRAIDPALPARRAFAALEAEALEIHEDDRRKCESMGEYGSALLPPNATVVTHCNAGSLATGGIGTALGVVYAAARAGKKIRVFADETRPLLQGARLTTYELSHNGIDVTLMTDGMSASMFSRIGADAVIVGADRIARNGDTANKIGTFTLAIAAHFHGVPFYVAAPTSTFDLDIAGGKDIPIEQRAETEVTKLGGRRSAPGGVGVYNPAFDVTPARLITAIITERGVIRPVTESEVLRVAGPAAARKGDARPKRPVHI